jgi:hypothetical protein
MRLRLDLAELTPFDFNDARILATVRSAFERVQVECQTLDGAESKPADRSQRWLNALNDELRESYHRAGDAAVRSLCKACSDNKAEFGLNELLHDVCVIRIDTVESHLHKKLLPYVKDVLWQIESEFNSSGTEVAIDFNKLILGSAQNKLYVGPLKSGTIASIKTVHAKFAGACQGNVYLALLPTPESWPTPKRPQMYRFESGQHEWLPI